MCLSCFAYNKMLLIFCHICSPISYHFLNFKVAIIAGNFDLAEIIKVHKTSDVGKLTAEAGNH